MAKHTTLRAQSFGTMALGAMLLLAGCGGGGGSGASESSGGSGGGSGGGTGQTSYKIVATNDLGMHCVDATRS